jgi:uncharacterized protein YuzE
MRVKKDEKLDIAYIQLRKGRVARTNEMSPGLLFDFDKKGNLVGIEVLSLTKLAPALAKTKKAA